MVVVPKIGQNLAPVRLIPENIHPNKKSTEFDKFSVMFLCKLGNEFTEKVLLKL
jgi:hypothetical protein